MKADEDNVGRPPGTVEMLYSAAEIGARVGALATEIADNMGPDIMVVAVLKGSFVFTADLLRALHHHGVHPRIDFMTLSSYGTGTQSSGDVIITRDITDDVHGAKILLIDDILESGRTLAFARELLEARGAEVVQLCVLLDKPEKRKIDVNADYVGFAIGDAFVVGYGLDYAHYYRELPYIGSLDLNSG
ncbi:MAG: hypoxanthine phosphoribosyltransferase [Rhodospirillaceae bacterium]|jgi:hypoxanthine phosphoribosyltransferase|nr:hypoxanthine phosphoribosyltransferase [Rhodospirillaceae bacterium]MBT4046675.1 hypoxanthine phosphoribosyltransferase [Rhodospirillaceae bacterium]MBT4691251.1 hypoxanthine phosphoribosyltransferase [Rhodospirillaceae bacterium]MBT5082538.1 hypoxanthine phosphoribosyltransferase [Rhodospirillaceae bacterium]MBT5525413.1 hypoxanthine phosphoribosyltransferase [Rhodospirillaceae bacterium]